MPLPKRQYRNYTSNAPPPCANLMKSLKRLWHRFLIAPFIAFKEFVITVYIMLFRKTASVIIGDFSEKNRSSVPEDPQMETFVINSNDSNDE